MDPIGTFSGLASGIQWRDMVDQIMQVEISRRITPLQDRVNAATRSRDAWSSYNSLLSKLVTSSAALRDQSAFNAAKMSVATTLDGKSLLTASASTGASPGSYQVEVINLARAEKLSGGAFASTTDQLGIVGEFFVNGKKVELAAADSLTSVRDKINQANSGANPTGVTATILSTSGTEHRLVLTSNHTGSRGIELVDGASGALESLGVVTGGLVANLATGDSSKTQTQRFTAKSSPLAALLGVTAPPATTTIVVDGQKIEVDLENDTLLTLANKIAASGGNAETSEEVVGGRTMYRLTVDGAVSADATGTDPAASQRIVELLGFQTAARASQIATGQDARFRIDGFTMTRRTNTVSDAISGVTLNLSATNSAQRTSSVTGDFSIATDPKTIDAGTYAISLLTDFQDVRTVTPSSGDLTVGADPGVADGTYAVSLTETVTRTTSTSDPSLSILASPGTTSPGTYDVAITALAKAADALGSGFGASYAGVGTPDTITITDGSGASAAVNIANGESLATIVTNLNNAFTANGVTMQAVDDGGQLRLTSTTTANSASTFTVASSHTRIATNFGIANGTYTGNDIAGTIGGLAATGSGNVLTGSAGATQGLQVDYTGVATGTVGSVTVTDTAAITDGTIGGFAATWNEATRTLTADPGSALDGFSVVYSGSATSGSVGDIVVETNSVEYITGGTIDGEAATWDDTTNTLIGGADSSFEGLELSYFGAATAGAVGELTVEGDIAVKVDVSRDLDATVKRVEELAAAYNEVVAFVKEQGKPGAALYANGSLRAIQSSLTGVLLDGVEGLASTNQYTHASIAGLNLTKTGTLEVDKEKLKSALQTNHADISALFGKAGVPTDARVTFVAGTDTAQAGNYAIAITAAATRATDVGSVWGGTYAATDGVDDVLSLTDSSSGKSTDFTVRDGMSLAELVAELNAQLEADGLNLTASAEGGALRLVADDYGSAATMTVAGDAAAVLGLTAAAHAGTDVAGTIGGLAATGNGRVLTGSEGAVEGLAILYSGVDVGAVGDISYALGVAGMFERAITPMTRSGDGTIVNQLTSIDQSIDRLNGRMDDAETRLEVRRQAMIKQFTRMEGAMALLQSQGQWLTSQINSLQRSSNS